MRILKSFVICICLVSISVAHGGTTIVDDNFDNYADDAAFNAVWRTDVGNGNESLPLPLGILVPRIVSPFPPPPFDGTGDPKTMPPVDPIPAGEQAVVGSFSFGSSEMP